MVHPKFDQQSGDEKVTAWGGMRLMKEGLQRSGVSGWLGQVALQQPVSNRGYNPQVVVESCLVNIRMSCCRMSHTQVLRHDPTLKGTLWLEADAFGQQLRAVFQQVQPRAQPGGFSAVAEAFF